MASNGASRAPSSLDGFEDIAPATGTAPTPSSTKVQTNHALSNLNPNSIKTPPSKPVKICVFCGASPGKSPAHMEAARSLANVMAANNIQLVYGGGTVGLMGEIARNLAALSGPESVHGIIPAPLVKYERGLSLLSSAQSSAKEEEHANQETPGPDSDAIATHALDGLLPEYNTYGKTTVVKDMHTRKQMMAQEVLNGGEGSGFIALSGGYGTLEELMEMVTWNQLGIHNRGVVVLNVEGYWDGLLEWVRKSVETGFVGEGNASIIAEATTGEGAVRALREYRVAKGRFKLEWGNE